MTSSKSSLVRYSSSHLHTKYYTNALLTFRSQREEDYSTRLESAREKSLDLALFLLQLLIFGAAKYRAKRAGSSQAFVSNRIVLPSLAHADIFAILLLA